jgi:hypothetical protein
MADQDIALQVQTPLANFQPGADLSAATNYNIGQTQLQRLNRINQGEDIQYRGQLIRDAAAHALDADSWDTAMRSAAKNGAPEALQYVGRYTPLLQQRLFDAYAGGAQGGAGTSGAATSGLGATQSTELLDRTYQNVSPQQMAASLQKNNAILGILGTVRDQRSHDAAVAQLNKMGIPAQQYLGTTFDARNTVRLYNDRQQAVNYLQSRVIAAATGAPAPLVKNETKEVGGVLYGVDPYTQRAVPMTAPLQKPVENAYGPNGEPIFYTEQQGLVGPGSAGAAGGSAAPLRPGRDAWIAMVKEARPELATMLSDNQILELRGDQAFSRDMAQTMAAHNGGALAKANLPVTPASLALAHKFGMDDATKIMNAAPNTPMEKILPAKVMAEHPELKGQTAGNYAQGLINNPALTREAIMPLLTPSGGTGAGPAPVATPGPQQTIFHKGEYDKPQLAEIDDGQGGTKRMMVQQNNRTGQWVSADQNRAPVDAANMVILPESMAGGGGARTVAMTERVLESARQGTNDLANIATLPVSSSVGNFLGYEYGEPKSIWDATKKILLQTVQPQEVQDFRTSMGGLGRALGNIEAMGLSPPGSLSKSFETLALLPTDTNMTRMRKLAQIRQDIEGGLGILVTSPYIGKKQADAAKGLLSELEQAVPWTVKDVNALERSKNPKATLSDFAKGAGLAPIEVKTPEEAHALTPGKRYVTPDGKVYVR